MQFFLFLRRQNKLPEPVFGQIKQARGFCQFLMRGIDNVRAEWSLVCTAHNVLKLAKGLTEIDRGPRQPGLSAAMMLDRQGTAFSPSYPDGLRGPTRQPMGFALAVGGIASSLGTLVRDLCRCPEPDA